MRNFQKVSSDVLLRKTKIYSQTFLIPIWYTHFTLLFSIISTIVEVLVIEGRQVLYLFIVGRCHLQCKLHVVSLFDFVVFIGPSIEWISKITWCDV